MVYYIWLTENVTLVVISFIVIFFMVEYLAVYKPIKNVDRTKRGILDFYFQNWVDNARYRKRRPEIRISVLLKKFHLINFHFFQYYQYNMEDYPDCNLHFWAKRGFTGECFNKDIASSPYLCDLRKYSEEEILKYYNFNKKLYERTKHIKTLVCVPLQKKVKYFPHPVVPKFKKIGLFCVDAIDNRGADFLSVKEVLQEIKFLYELVEKIYT